MKGISVLVLVFIGIGIVWTVYYRYNVHTDVRDLVIINTKNMLLTSPAFTDGGLIPPQYTCEGEGRLSPPLVFAGVPTEAKSLALIMKDPDVPREVRDDQLYIHWLLFNIPPTTTELAQGESAGTPGINTGGGTSYVSPCPPAQFAPKEHRYIFTLYALDATMPLETGVSKEELVAAMDGHILEQAGLIGRYKKQQS